MQPIGSAKLTIFKIATASLSSFHSVFWHAVLKKLADPKRKKPKHIGVTQYIVFRMRCHSASRAAILAAAEFR